MAFPYHDPYGYYQPTWGAPATAPPSGGENQIQFGTFPGLPQEFPNPAMGGPGAYPMYPVPQYQYMGHGGHPAPPQPPQPAPPPNHGQRPSQRKPRDEKRRPDSNHRPQAPESRGSDRREQPDRHGNSSGYPPRGPPPAQAMGPPYPGYMGPPYGMFAYPPHPATFAPSPEYNHPVSYKMGSHRLPLDSPLQPPVSGHNVPRSSAQDAEAAQSPKSTTSNTSGVSRSRKGIPLVNPDTGQQLSHDDARQSQLGSSRQHQGGGGGGKEAASSSYADAVLLPPQNAASQASSQNGGVEPRAANAKPDVKAPNRTKRVVTSEVIVSSVKQAPSVADSAKKIDMPREKQRLPLQPPKNEDSAPAHQNKQRQKGAAPVDIIPQAQSVSRKDSPPRNTPPRSTPPREGLTLVKSTVVQVAVTQTQLPTKKSVPLKTSPSKTTDKEKGDSKLVRADSAARTRAPESKIPAAPTSVTKSSSPSNAASPAGSPLPEQTSVAEKIVPVEVAPKESPAPPKEPETSPEPENPKVDTPEAKEATPEKAKVIEVTVAPEGDSTEPQNIVVAESRVAENEEVETPEALGSGGRLGSRDVKSPETVIVNDGEDSQEEEEKPPNENRSSEAARDARSSQASKAGDGGDSLAKVEERESSRNGSERSERGRQDPPSRQDSIGRRASGSLKAGVSRSASFEKGWRMQRDSSRKSNRGRGDDYDVLHKPSGLRKYTVDYMCIIRDKCTEKPLGVSETSIWRDSIGSLKSRGSERSRWGGTKGSFDDRERRGDRQGSSAWRDAGRQFSGTGRQSSGRNQPRGRDMDERWGSKMSPSPFAGSGGGGSGLHHAEDRYVIGELRSDDPEEEKRQKKYKAVLNKLTPENFDRMFDQIIDVKVEEHKTLEGLIDQIFDKALTETTFCPLYANLCKKLMSTMPEFVIEGDKRKITFRRLLLNKCQNEFEKGDAALRAADAAEKSGSDAPEEVEKLRIAKKERMRSLGNMQFIGHLFKEEMLTEKIIHQCIVDLLREQDNPKPEDIECLCKLVSTVGRQLKEGKQLEAYFSRIQRLTENPNLDTRHQFMLQDLLELKSRNWIARRKAEGPKKIEEIRRDAQEELQKDARGGGRNWGTGLSSRSSNRDRGGGGGWSRGGPPSGPRGSAHAPLPNPPFEREVIEPLTKRTSIGRTNSEEISLRPGSAQRPYGRTPSSRPDYTRESSGREHRVTGRTAASPTRSDRQSGSTRERERIQAKPIPEEPMDPSELRRKVKGFLAEYYQVKDIGEVETCVRELIAKGASREDIVATAIIQALDLRNIPTKERLVPLCAMMCGFLKSGILKPTNLRKGLEEALATIPDLAEDFPIVPELFADMMEDLSIRENIPVTTIAKIILGAGQDRVPEGEDTALIDLGYGIQIFLRILKKQKQGGKLPAETKDRLMEVNIVNLFPAHERATVKLEEVLSFLDPTPQSAP